MEIFDLYDRDRIKTGETMERGGSCPDGRFRMVVHISIINSEGKMLIQKRQPFKHGWSGLWDVTVGGSAVAGENSRQAAERELFEEIGLKIDFSKRRPVFTVNFRDGFDDNYVLIKDVDTAALKLQQEEVEAVKWADFTEVCEMIDKGTFIPYHKSYISLLFDMADGSDSHKRARSTRTVSHPQS